MYIKVWSLTFSSDLRKPGLVPGESLSTATIFGSVLEKIQIHHHCFIIYGFLCISIMPFLGWFNNSVAGLGAPCVSGVDPICNKAICWSLLVWKHFINVVHFMSLMHASTVCYFDGGMMMILLVLHSGLAIKILLPWPFWAKTTGK